MAANQPPWPREWLMTDERMDDRLWSAIGALPEGTGIVFRHYSLSHDERRLLGIRIGEVSRERGLTLAVAGDVGLANLLKGALVHNPAGDPGTLPFSRSAHSVAEADGAIAAGASLIFLSPIFATRSHPARTPMPREVARQIVANSPIPVVALGGVNRTRFVQLERDGFYGWAGIDAWSGD